MNNFTSLSTNICISDNPDWGDYIHEVVYEIIKSIDINFSVALELLPFSSCFCLIEHWDEDPMCSRIHNGHLIHLSAKENYWCQWIYQFAHEYCHHLINGMLTGDIKGLMWFEETICHLASMYHLHILQVQWRNRTGILSRWDLVLRDHLDALFSKHTQLISDTHHQGFLQTWLPILEQPIYHRDYYNALSARIFPLFVENPHLWKIILHFGDMRKWNSLHELFEHLQSKASQDYAHTLQKLYNLLFS